MIQFPISMIRTGALLSALVIAAPGAAQTVDLTSADGVIALSGELLSFENGVYRIETDIGELNISATSVSCTGSGCPEAVETRGDFAIAGSDTIGASLMPLLIKGYADAQGAAVDVQEVAERTFLLEAIGDGGYGETLFATVLEDKGSSTGFRALLAGAADIGMSSRRISREEVAAFRDAGLGDPLSFNQERTLAVDGLLVVVHPDNPVSQLRDSEVSAILSGVITNWDQLGGPDLPVTVYSRGSASGTHATIAQNFLEPFNARLSADAVLVAGNQDMKDAVFSDPGGIGYVGFAYQADLQPVGLISSCGVVADPSAFAAKTGEYPLQRTLYLYNTNREMSQDAQRLIAFATSAEASGLIEKSGFLSYDVSARAQQATAAAVRTAIEETASPSEVSVMREMYIDLQEYERLSSTFRFRTGSSVLDNASQRDLVRLIGYLQQQGPDIDIALVGFTDSDGTFDANRALGLSRADAVRNKVAAVSGESGVDVSQIEIKSYGELNPVACNDDFRGQRLNRRVEVWVRR